MIQELLMKCDIKPVLYTDQESDWTTFESLINGEVEALLERYMLKGKEEDYLWIVKHPDGYYYLFCLANSTQEEETIGALAKTRIVDLEIALDTTYLEIKPANFSLHEEHIVNNFRWLTQEDGLDLPPDFPMFKKQPLGLEKNKLVIKHGSADAYIAQLPFSYYGRFDLGFFNRYTWMEFISTHKDYLTHLKDWLYIEGKGKNIASFILHAVIIVNAYEHLELESSESADYKACFCLLEKVRASFAKIQIGKTYFPLKLLINPTKEQVLDALESRNTWFVFANFHTEDLKWTLPSRTEDFYQEVMGLDLSHILLMRVYHCYSFKNASDGKSIGGRFLQKGVKRVEGSIRKQSMADYLEYLLAFFNQPVFKSLLDAEASLQQELEDMYNRFQKIVQI
ncbi:hypothetical protein HB364_29585 [Pseudoflavitalea sp. X16]|uniref:hypothetical protein n=1 Tax=Paraflavitalea devenefica TaxID=2716334 RepID=UPI001423FEBD|nr:hypothetical protein [Paraflavitalea devenefica]NII29268.1 hypothetical protein [Paraflavitalea devenefica]